MALEEKKIPYQYIEVNPYHKPDSLLQLNPRGLVPTLSCPTTKDDSLTDSRGAKPLYESNVVVEYLEEAYPDHLPHLLPHNDPYEKARARMWIDFVTSRIIPSFYRFLQYQINGDDDGGIGKLRSEFLGHLKQFTKAMDEEGPFFLGREFGMPDLVLAPWAVKLWVLDEFKIGGAGIPAPGEGGEDEAVWARWRKWLEAVENRPSLTSTMSEKEHYVPIFKRYADNTAQSELAKATRAGKGVP